MRSQIAVATLLLSLAGCAALPNEQQVARRYEREHPGRRVVGVATSSEGEGMRQIVDFQITYADSEASTPRTDHIEYGRAPEGAWLPFPSHP